MTDISFASPTTNYGGLQSTLASAGGRVPPKGDIIAAPGHGSFSNPDDFAEMKMTTHFRYSRAVRARFYLATCLLLLAAGLSALALVQDSEKLGIASAGLLSVSAIFTLAWLERADHERTAFGR